MSEDFIRLDEALRVLEQLMAANEPKFSKGVKNALDETLARLLSDAADELAAYKNAQAAGRIKAAEQLNLFEDVSKTANDPSRNMIQANAADLVAHDLQE